MLQLELYVADLKAAAKLFTSVFNMVVDVEKPGFVHLRHPTRFDIMLFNPQTNMEGEAHWTVPRLGEGGQGIEIVIVTDDAAGKMVTAQRLGYSCSALRHTPWGSVEFVFRLPEGYLLRVKEVKTDVRHGAALS